MDEETIRDMTVQFSSNWYRCQSCEPKRRKDRWVLHFSGDVTPYKPDFDTYRDFLNLAIEQKSMGEKPGDDVVEFLRKWGPLGIFYRDFDDMDYDHGPLAAGLLAHTLWLGGVGKGVEPFEEYWMRNHTRKLRIPLKNYPAKAPSPILVADLLSPDNVFRDYSETWLDVFGDLYNIRRLISEVEDKDLRVANINFKLYEYPLAPYLDKDPNNPKEYEWSFSFKSLGGALIGLMAQDVIGEVDMRKCQNPTCGRYFDAKKTGTTTYCRPKCQREGPDNRKLQDPVKKYRRMLQERLKRCPEELVSQKKSKAIKVELLQAKSVKELKNIEEKKYPVILGIKRGSAK